MSHTYAILEVSPAVYAEVRGKLEAAGYQHAFDRDVIDMHGIALRAEIVLADAEPGVSECKQSERGDDRGLAIAHARALRKAWDEGWRANEICAARTQEEWAEERIARNPYPNPEDA